MAESGNGRAATHADFIWKKPKISGVNSSTPTTWKIILQRTQESLPKGISKPRIISDNELQNTSTEFRSYLRDKKMVHSRIRVNIPKTTARSRDSTRV